MVTVIVDAHCHVGIRQQIWGLKKQTAEDQIRQMDRAGVDKAIIFSPCSGLVRPEHFVEGNDFVADAVRQYPDRLFGFCLVTPMYGELAVREVDRCVQTLGMRGIKLYPPGHGFYPVDSPIVDPIVEKAIEYGIPVQIHTDYNQKVCTPYQVCRLARRFPEATFIMAHMGMDPDLVHFVPDLVEDLPNVYLEISCTPDLPGSVVKLPVDRLGAHRVLF
ncbi:MAG TPA: amidohydrolase, partial [Firmicutes bacterium]|nr:amidohydrolase [Bacillota bacterium]